MQLLAHTYCSIVRVPTVVDQQCESIALESLALSVIWRGHWCGGARLHQWRPDVNHVLVDRDDLLNTAFPKAHNPVLEAEKKTIHMYDGECLA